MLRKVAGAAASKPHVEIRQDGEQFYIKTSTTVRTTEINFHIGQEFDEETVDGRKCKVCTVGGRKGQDVAAKWHSTEWQQQQQQQQHTTATTLEKTSNTCACTYYIL